MFKTCPSCNKTDVDIKSTICDCGWQFSSAQTNTFIPPTPVRLKNAATLELALAIDRTGSSAQFKTGIETTYDLLVQEIKKKVSDITVWAYTHGDLDYNEDFVTVTTKGSPEQVAQDIKSIIYEGGGDIDETHCDALEELLNLTPFSQDKSKVRTSVILFSTGDTKPPRSGRSFYEIGKMFSDRGIVLCAVSEPQPNILELIRGAGATGFLFPISNNPSPHEMTQYVSRITASITQVGGTGTI